VLLQRGAARPDSRSRGAMISDCHSLGGSSRRGWAASTLRCSSEGGASARATSISRRAAGCLTCCCRASVRPRARLPGCDWRARLSPDGRREACLAGAGLALRRGAPRDVLRVLGWRASSGSLPARSSARGGLGKRGALSCQCGSSIWRAEAVLASNRAAAGNTASRIENRPHTRRTSAGNAAQLIAIAPSLPRTVAALQPPSWETRWNC